MNHSFIWLRAIGLIVFITIATAVEYSVTVLFCSDQDRKHFQDLGQNLVMTRNVNPQDHAMLAAWQSIPIDHCMVHNEVKWEETFNLVARKVEGLNNAILKVDTPTTNVETSKYYELTGGTFIRSETCCTKDYYCATNKQAPTDFHLALSQTVQGEESIVAAASIGFNGMFQVQPNTIITLFCGTHEKNELIKEQISYPKLDISLNPGNTAAVARFDPGSNRFILGKCPYP